MKTAFVPIIDKLYVFNKHSLLFWETGPCRFEVDFHIYSFPGNHVISLSPGQYFKFISGPASLSLYEFPDQTISSLRDSRLLFRHIISVGHISLNQSSHFLQNLLPEDNNQITHETIINSGIADWLTLNPFKSSVPEINLLFDLKEVIDQKYREPISVNQMAHELRDKPYRIKKISKEKLHSTIHLLASQKQMLEARRNLAFTNLSTKEIAYELGFKDPKYFTRFFKQQSSNTPQEFRNQYEFEDRDSFKNDLIALIDTHFRDQRFVEFYADKLAINPQSLSRKIGQKLGTTFTVLISERITEEAKTLLRQKMPVNIIAFNLGFKEPNHFSAFFKNMTGTTPTLFQSDFQ